MLQNMTDDTVKKPKKFKNVVSIYKNTPPQSQPSVAYFYD